MRKKLFVFISIFVFVTSSLSVFSTIEEGYIAYWVGFMDKANTPYSLSSPTAFLSPRAIERRQKANITLAENDLPVVPQYVSQVLDAGGILRYTSKWLNGVVVSLPESNHEALAANLQVLPFVKMVKPISTTIQGRRSNTKDTLIKQETDLNELYYGTAATQLQMLNVDFLHALNYKGQGMQIAIFDAGFDNADQLAVFQPVYAAGRVLGTKDFVTPTNLDIYDFAAHGTEVWSTIAGSLPNVYVGSAPEASFWLFRTEDTAAETTLEEYNWLAAAEFADSAGVDIINSSLGYSTFDLPEMNYTYEDLNGDIAVVTRAADFAAAKGILVVSSAGNQGNKPWQHITAPADADSILTVGAVNGTGDYAVFSSKGPSSDGNIKPNVAAQGQGAALVNPAGELIYANGTSFSSPIMAGLVACLWQAYPQQNNMDIIHALEKSGTQADHPDEKLGYGIPKADLAYWWLKTEPLLPNTSSSTEVLAFAYPNPTDQMINLYYLAPKSGTVNVTLYDMSGKTISTLQQETAQNIGYKFDFQEWSYLSKGWYLVKVSDGTGEKVLKVGKL